jgi:enoyl-CoA hydratase
VSDTELIDSANELAARAGEAPRELVIALKSTLAATAAVTDHHQAVDLELDPQVASLRASAFQDRLTRLRERIAARRPAQQGEA